MIAAAILAAVSLAAALVKPVSRLVRSARHERAVNQAAKEADERMRRAKKS